MHHPNSVSLPGKRNGETFMVPPRPTVSEALIRTTNGRDSNELLGFASTRSPPLVIKYTGPIHEHKATQSSSVVQSFIETMAPDSAVFLMSNPLAIEYADHTTTSIHELNTTLELSTLLDAVRQANKAVVCYTSTATSETFYSSLRQPGTVRHHTASRLIVCM